MSESKLNDAGVQYLWSKIKSMFALKTDVPSPATANPGMDSVSGQVGASLKYAREDHTHPKDSSKANVASPTFTGVPSAPTPATGTASTQIATTEFVANSIAANNSAELPKKQNVLDAGRNITLTQLSTGHVRIDGVDLTPLWNLLNDKVDDILVNGNSIVSTLTSGEKIASMTLQAGTNISIVRTGNVFRINNTASGGTGDVTLHTGITEPSNDLGTNHDIYLKLSTAVGDRVDLPTLTSGGAYRNFNYTVDLTNKVYNFWVVFYDSWEYHGFLTFRYDNLTVGKTYRISFNYKTDETPVLYGVGELYGATIQYTSSCIDGRNVSGMVTGGEFKRFTDTYYGNFEYQSFIEDNQLHTYTFDFVAESSTVYFGMYGDRINMNALQVHCTGIVIGEVEEGNEIEDVYYKVNGEWLLYEGTNEIAELEDVSLTNLADGEILKYNATTQKWENAEDSGGSEVEANPSGTATDTLTKLGIDGTVYEIQGGGGGGGSAIYREVTLYNAPDRTWRDITLADSLLNYDLVLFHVHDTTYNGSDANHQHEGALVFTKQELIDCYNDTKVLWLMGYGNTYALYTLTDYQTLTANAQVSVFIQRITGVKFGSSQVSPIIYSTEEREVGVWTDNKPLYQKTFEFNQQVITDNAWTTNILGTVGSGIKIVDYEGMFGLENTNPHFADFSYYRGSSEYFTAYVPNNNGHNDDIAVRPNMNAGVSVTLDKVTIWYTKDSDTAGSGSYNTLGVPNVHYTTDEQVIGTWIDGKPLYRAVLDFSSSPIAIPNNQWLKINNTWAIQPIYGRAIIASSRACMELAVDCDDNDGLYIRSYFTYSQCDYVIIEYTKDSD